MDLQVAPTAELSAAELRDIRAMVVAAFTSDFSVEDWDHTVGGIHVWLRDDRGPVSHGALVERTLVTGAESRTVAYVEGVATRQDQRRHGYGSRVLTRIGELIRASYPLGALSTKEYGFYGRLGWELWRGPTFVDAPGGRERTSGDDGDVMILRTPTSPALDLDREIVCDWRSGDVW